MKKTLFAIGVLVLAGCSSSSETRLDIDLSMDVTDTALVSSLLTASQKVVERMTYAIEDKAPIVSMENIDTNPRMNVVLFLETTKAILSEQLKRPFSLRLMRTAAEGEEADLSTEQWGDFMETGIDQNLIYWVTAEPDTDGTAKITILFSEEGQDELGEFFAENHGERVGLFVHSGLVSTYIVQEDGLKDAIVITGIPSLELASIFSDDVNVGLHVTFTPIE